MPQHAEDIIFWPTSHMCAFSFCAVQLADTKWGVIPLKVRSAFQYFDTVNSTLFTVRCEKYTVNSV